MFWTDLEVKATRILKQIANHTQCLQCYDHVTDRPREITCDVMFFHFHMIHMDCISFIHLPCCFPLIIRDLIWCFLARAGAAFASPLAQPTCVFLCGAIPAIMGWFNYVSPLPLSPVRSLTIMCCCPRTFCRRGSPSLCSSALELGVDASSQASLAPRITITNLMGSSVQNAARLEIRGSGRFSL